MSISTSQRASVPLTAAQLGVWFAQQLNPEVPVYNLAQYVEIHGRVDADVLAAAIRQARQECGSFDVRFGEDSNGPYQLISATVGEGLVFVDVSQHHSPMAAAESITFCLTGLVSRCSEAGWRTSTMRRRMACLQPVAPSAHFATSRMTILPTGRPRSSSTIATTG